MRWMKRAVMVMMLTAPALAQQTGNGGVPGAGSGGGATIPATTSLLKGSGSLGAATAATAGADYIAPSPAAAQAIAQPSGTTLGVNNLNNTFYVDGFPSSCTVSSVAYTTQADCAFYSAKAYTVANNVNTKLVFGQGSYSTNASFVEPINLYAVNLMACGVFCTHLTYTGASAVPVISRADGGSSFTFLQIKDMTIDGGGVASSIMDLYALNQSVIENINAVNIAPGQDHFIKFGSTGGDNFQLHARNLDIYAPAAYNSPATYATVTANVVGGAVTSYTVNNGGAGYPGTSGLTVGLTGFQNGTSYKPCTTMPTATATVSGGVITAVTPVTNGSGCSGTVDVQVYNMFPVNYGVIWNASDSTGDDIVTYVGSIAGIQINGGNGVFHHLHPALIPVGIQNNTNSAFEGTELDSIYKFGMDFEFISGGAGSSIYGTSGYSGNRVLPGESAYYFGAGAGNAIFGAQGNLCNGTKPADWHEFVTQTGTIEQGASYPTGVSVLGNDLTCATTGDYTPQVTAKVINGLTLTANATGFSVAGGSTPKTLSVANSMTLAGTDGATYTLPGGTAALAPLAAPVFTGAATAGGFFPQAKAAGPFTVLFDDYYSGANNASNNIGTPTAQSCAVNTTYTDINHPGNILLTSGTGGTGTGITCGYQSQNASVIAPNSAALGWTWETAVYVPVLPGTTAGSFQAGLTGGPNVNPWTTGIQFYLSSANSVANDWYCRYSATSIDSTVTATAATWTRLTMVNDGTFVHWYINGAEAAGCKTAVGSMPAGAQYPASWSATGLSATSVTMSVDYVDFQRATAR